jgi:hypothetical protein
MKSVREKAKKNSSPASGWFWLAIAVLIILKLWLARGMTFNGIGYMAADDQLFIHQAGSILQGDWLGEYNYLTLFKGPFYPLFIAFFALLGLPLLTAQQCLYAAACLLICLACVPLIRHKGLLILPFTALLFNPMSVTNTVATRALREGIYPALTLLVLAGTIGLILRLDRPFKQRLAWMVLTGCALSAFWLTREERIWLLPSLVMLAGVAILRAWIENRNPCRAVLVSLVIPVLMLGTTILAISGFNLKQYGVFAITEYDNPLFLKAYGSLTRVTPETWQPLIPVAAETRARIYAVSPSFKKLEPYLEGDLGRLYARYGELVKTNRNEMGGGWFHIAFRQSIDQAGFTAGGKFPADFYRQLSDEINTACNDGSLKCGPARKSFMAVWNNAYLKPLLENTWKAVTALVTFNGYDARLKDCLGTPDQLKPFIELTHERCWHTQPSVLVEGWVVKPGEAISIWVYDQNGQKVESPTYTMISPDVAEHFSSMGIQTSGAAIARFQLEADCPAGCLLVIKGDDGSTLEQISLAELSGSPDQADENGLYYQLETIDWRQGDEQKYGSLVERNTFKTRILSKIAIPYQVMIPFFMVVSILIFIVQSIWTIWKRKDPLVWGITTAVLIGILIRVVMVAWLESSSIHAIITTYLAPVYPLLLVFISLGFYWLAGEISGGRLRRRKHQGL